MGNHLRHYLQPWTVFFLCFPSYFQPRTPHFIPNALRRRASLSWFYYADSARVGRPPT